MAPLSFIILLYSNQSLSNGIMLSQEFLVIPYGKSHNIISIDLSFIFFISTRQSPLIRLKVSISNELISFDFSISILLFLLINSIKVLILHTFLKVQFLTILINPYCIYYMYIYYSIFLN